MISLKNITHIENDDKIFHNFSLHISHPLVFIECKHHAKKELFLDLILGKKKPTEGTIQSNNTSILYDHYKSLLAYRKHLAVFSEERVSLLSNLNAYENIIIFGEYFYKARQNNVYAEAMNYVRKCKVENLLTKLPYEMSHDEQCLVYFIMMLMKHPKVFIIDFEFSKLHLSTNIITGIITEKETQRCSFIIFGNSELRKEFHTKEEYSF